MDEPKGERRFEHRLIDGFDRSRIRREVLRSKAKDIGTMGRLRKRYATLVLGASLAVGGIGIPMKVSRMLDNAEEHQTRASKPISSDVILQISDDLRTANDITRSVAGGVTSAADVAANTLTSPILPPAEDQEQLNPITEAVRAAFFKSEIPFGSIIYKEATKNDIQPELLAAVVKTESRFVPNALSHRGAQGLMQLVPKTGRWMGATNLMNPAENVAAGAKYLRYLNDRFGGDQTKVIAAYNSGEGNVRRFGGVPPFRETQQYVQKVMSSKADFHDQVTGKLAEAITDAASLPPGR